MEQIIKLINEYQRIIIHGHTRPDGDCIGSQIGLREILKETYPDKEVYAVGPMSEFVSFLGELDNITDDLYNGALAIVVDCGNSERISDQRFKLADKVIKIDHHVPVEDYGDVNYVLEDEPACAAIITEIMDTYKMKINKQGAMALYTGILTDTGRFRFDTVNGKTLRLAAILLDNGVRVDELDNLLSIETLKEIKLKGYVLSHFETTDQGFAYIKMTRDVVSTFGVSDETAASQVSTIGNIEGYPVWALFMEYPDEIRIRLRSRGPRIDLLANQYGGGGHQKAAGGRLESWDMLPQFIEDINKLLSEQED